MIRLIDLRLLSPASYRIRSPFSAQSVQVKAGKVWEVLRVRRVIGRKVRARFLRTSVFVGKRFRKMHDLYMN